MLFHKKLLLLAMSLFVLTTCTSMKEVFQGHNVPLISGSDRETRSEHEDQAPKYMVVTQCPYATKAGLEVINQGGNLFDAAIAVSFTLAVTRPESTSIGGGGFLLFYTPEMQKPLSLDFREKAPTKAFRDMFLGKKGNFRPEKSWSGIWAGAVPGLVDGMIEIHKKYGKLPLIEIMRPSINLAEEGFPVHKHLADAIEERKDVLERYLASKKIFFREDGKTPLKEGDVILQKDLANTLKTIAEKGRDGFYRGKVAAAIIKEQKRLGGLISLSDLNHYHSVYRPPVHGTYKSYDIFSMAPPSSGGTHILQILNIIEDDPIKKWGPADPRTIHLVSSAMQLAFADRAKYLGDPDYVEVPIKGLLSKDYAKLLRTKISLKQANPQEEIIPGNPYQFESEETTHFTIMDGKGNVVSSTQTVNGHLGSGIVIPGTGILLNNQMDDFASKLGEQNYFGAIGGYNNLIKGKKRPLSSMSPTLVMRNGTPILSLGTPAGTRIISCITLSLLYYLEFGLPLRDSIMGIRYHHQWYPDRIWIDSLDYSEKVTEQLKAYGHKLKFGSLGCKVQAIAKENSILHGFSDMRGSGMAKGI